MKWRDDSAISDGSIDNMDLSGGYYDAGDNVKFGLPMAFTTTMLSWSVLEFGDSMGDDLQHTQEAIRWATNYLLKATSTPGVIYVQVGEPNADHQCWERPEDMDTPRNVYKVDSEHPGSDVAAETAAALAAASIVFKTSDASYSQTLIKRALQVFDFADKYRGSYSDSLPSAVCPFYCSYSGYQDELLWGASWLQKATEDASYANYIVSNAQSLGLSNSDNVLSWDQKHGGAKILLARQALFNKVGSFKQFRYLGDNVVCSLLSAKHTPGGLFHGDNDQSNMQYVTSTTFLLFTYAKYLRASNQVARCGNNQFTADSIRGLAKRQIDYILGENPLGMSYMVGYSTKFPQHIHHRGSSLPSKSQHPGKIGCNDGFSEGLKNNGPNPNVLVGAIVGGPDFNDQFRDDRNDYSHSEPTTYINAPLVGCLAALA
ncbi:endoglucanase 1-like [Cryptomeria japonica]|uniref:endoglucanase 1-like n=1 Tax=Cryptomeria japonica TaxID=3369 RepID=UPI0027D9FA09|nr:endoglucanase 1-like [Cryptomeria japonica]